MELNEAPAKRIIKMTGKAKAALEDKASSKKCKPDGSGDSMNPLLPKKARKMPGLFPLPTPPSIVARSTIVHTEEEVVEEVDNNEPANGDEVDDADENPEDELKQLMKE
ncbi:hypothetical protein BDR04DRAFT_1118466 [Suillus decipiens]|nr:hypothetical protein BDR04DRAFT_1118466 [Suillus decipiens]